MFCSLEELHPVQLLISPLMLVFLPSIYLNQRGMTEISCSVFSKLLRILNRVVYGLILITVQRCFNTVVAFVT